MEKIKRKCKMCPNLVKRKNSIYCSRPCRGQDKILYKKSSIKAKQTCLQKYGVDNPSKSKEVKNRVKETNLKKSLVQNEEIKEKRKQTCLRKYGVSTNLISTDGMNIRNEKGGEITKKRKQTNIKKSGYEFPFMNREIRNKAQTTIVEKYGVLHFKQSLISDATRDKLDSYEWLCEEYKNKSTRQIALELGVSQYTVEKRLAKHNIPKFRMASFSKKAIQWLNSVEERDNILIQHAGNNGEYNIPGTNLLVDGYCKENNTVYEFYGDSWHGNPNIFTETDKCHPKGKDITAGDLYNKTMERENKIRTLGYNVVSIWENEY